MDLISSYAPLFLEAQLECQNHRREMCQIVTGSGSDEEVFNKLRDSILRYRARVPKKVPETQLPKDEVSLMQIFTFIKTQGELFEKHDRLVDEIANDLKEEAYTIRERLELVRRHLM